MALEKLEQRLTRNDQGFYRHYYHYFIIGLMVLILLLLLAISRVFFQVLHRPLPDFTALEAGNLNERMLLQPFEEPNQLAGTLIRFASKAASTAYTFDFVNYEAQIAAARPYFTDSGWNDFRAAIAGTVSTIVKNQLFVNGVVNGTPVISNQGPLPGQDYVWRVQVPFLVTYQSANQSRQSSYIVILSIVKVPTSTNPQGIGIDQFVMANQQ